MPPMPRKTFHFADLTLSPELRRLSRGSEALAVEPRVLDLIIVLVRERDRIVSKQELFDEVWSDVVVATGALDRAIHEARRVLADGGNRQATIRTVRGKGYQFVAPVRMAIAGAEVVEAPLFGRDAVLAELAGILDSHRRSLRIVAIEGEAGIGKTSLARRAAGMAAERGHAIRSGRCTETLGAPPFWPWIQLIAGDGEHATDPSGSESARPGEIAKLVGALEPDGLEGRAEQARFRLFDAVERHLRSRVDSPEVWLLDDLQWADDASLHLLAHLAGAPFDRPILVIATFREEGVDEDHVLRRTLARCALRIPVDHVRVPGLDATALRQLSLHLTGADPSDSALVALLERTGGNPFLASETLLRTRRSATAPDASSPSSSPGSISLASLVRSRLDLLDGDVQELLAVASVIGRRFDAQRLAAVVGRPAEAVRQRLREAVRAGIVLDVDAGIGRFEFRHDLLRESLYDSLPLEARGALHRRVGEALESLYGPRFDAGIEELALHFHEAADPAEVGKAIDYSIRAGESARAQLGFEQATHHFENALATLERVQSDTLRQQARVLLALADSAKRAGENRRALDALHRAARIARRLDDPTILIQAAFAMKLALSPIDVSASEVRDVMLLREALVHVPEENRETRARLLGRLSTALYWRPIHALPARRDIDQPTLDPDELEAFGWSLEVGLRTAEEAIGIARASGDPTALAHALSAQYIALGRTRRVDERRAIAHEVVRLAGAGNDLELRLVGQGLLLIELAQRGEVDAATEAVEALHELAERLRHPVSRWHASLGRTLERMIRGRLVEAERIATDAYQNARGDVNLSVEDCFIQQRFSIARFLGRIGELEPTIREAAARYGQMSNFVMMLALIALERGREDEARTHLDRVCADDFDEIGDHMLSVFTLALAGEVAVAVGSREQAQAIYDRLLPHGGRCVTINFVTFDGPVDRVLGLLAARMGEATQAAQHLERAIDLLRRMGSVAWLAQCLAEAWEVGPRSAPGAPATRWDGCLRESDALAKEHGIVRFQTRSLATAPMSAAGRA